MSIKYKERLRENDVSAAGLLTMLKVLGFEPSVFVQVGVGLRHPEIEIARELWPELGFIGFEPNRQTYEKIKRSYPGGNIFPWAISDTIGKRRFYAKVRHSDGSSLAEFSSQAVQTEQYFVDLWTLDQFFGAAYGSAPFLLWLDCEGSELSALRGATNILRSVDAVVLEMTAGPPSDEWGSTIETHDKLTDAGFLRQWMHCYHTGLPTGGKKMPAVAQYDALYVRPNLWRAEWCCCPETIKRMAKQDES